MKSNNKEQIESRCRDAIKQLLLSGRPFALFRYPQAEEPELILQMKGEAQTIRDTETPLSGFVFAPFHQTEEYPTLLISPDIHSKGWNQIIRTAELLPDAQSSTPCPTKEEVQETPSETRYTSHFQSTHSEIQKSGIEKIVLAHFQKETKDYHLWNREADVFLRALSSQPNTMVSLVYTEKSGRWIGCTPELLLSHTREEWCTMALAGTRTSEGGSWDKKNQIEQEVVTRYIRSILQELGAEVNEGPCTTMHAASLMHIRTDIHFRFRTPHTALQVAKKLHPTPAVCGFPKERALQHILKHEGESRRYYSGFLGTLFSEQEAHLFVNLRCAHICHNATFYHAGGGITILSQLSKEREEIERKMAVLKNLTHH